MTSHQILKFFSTPGKLLYIEVKEARDIKKKTKTKRDGWLAAI